MAAKPDLTSLVRPQVRALHSYVPGEQPKISGLVKLNTNENPYPPSPSVLAAIKAAVDGRLRLYPNPACDNLRARLANFHGCRPENIIVGNGSDELLAMAVRAFVEPQSTRTRHRRPSAFVVQYFEPSYSLYPVLADIHGAVKNAVSLDPDFSIPTIGELKRGRVWDFRAPLSFVTTPNAPSGRGYRTSDLEEICRRQEGVVVLDETYADFARENAMSLAFKHDNVLVSRTFSKAYSLCFQRVGYFVGAEPLIAGLHKIRDSYNVNGLGQTAAEATLKDLPYYRANFRRIVKDREQLRSDLGELGFVVLPSETNFVFAKTPVPPAERWLALLKQHKVLVRWFGTPPLRDYLRITVGTPAEMGTLIKAVKAILRKSVN